MHRSGSRTAATSWLGQFVMIVKGWKPLTIITKSSILGALDLPLNTSDRNVQFQTACGRRSHYWMCSLRKSVLRNLKNFSEKHPCLFLFFKNVDPWCFFYKFCHIFKNIFLKEDFGVIPPDIASTDSLHSCLNLCSLE